MMYFFKQKDTVWHENSDQGIPLVENLHAREGNAVIEMDTSLKK